MAVRARFGVHKKSVEKPESLRQSVCVGRDVLRRPLRLPRGRACAEDRQARVAVRARSVAGFFDIPENLIVGAILANHINHVMNRRSSSKKPDVRRADQSIVAHHLVCVLLQRARVRLINPRNIPSDQRYVVLPALAAVPRAHRKAVARTIRRAPGIIHLQ